MPTDREGVERAFASVYRERYVSLVGLARLLLDDPSRAEHTVADAFARALARSSGEPDDPYAEVRRQVVDLARNRLRSGSRSASAGHDREIAAALASLKHLDLECLVMRHYERCSDEGAAEALGAAPEVVDEHARHAEESMPAHLEPHELGPALRAEARTTEVAQPSWASVLDAATRAKGRRRALRIFATVGLVAAAAAVGLAIWSGVGEEMDHDLEIATSDPPAHVLIVTERGAMQVIRTSDGEVVRTVRRGLEPSRAPVAVTPDGRHAYMDQPLEGSDCDDALEILEIDLATGEADTFGFGRSPAVSHDGERLAYATQSDPGDCGRYDTLVVRGLADDSEERWTAEGKGVTYIRWSWDDDRLGYTLLDDRGYINWEASPTDLGAKPTRRYLRASTEPVGYMPDDRLLVLHSQGDDVELSVFHDEGEQLIAVRRNVSIDVSAVTVDRGGEHILWREGEADARGRLAPGSVMWLAIGGKPIEVAGDALQATWLERLVEAR